MKSDLQEGTDIIHYFCDQIGLYDEDHGKQTFEFSYSGIFAVRKEAILQHSYDFYANCYNINNFDSCYGFLFERIWLKMFSKQKKIFI